MVLERWVWSHLVKALDVLPACLLLGARQVGKTTLALKIAQQFHSVYLDLQDSQDRERLAASDDFLSRHSDKLVILDEIHRAPELFSQLRGLVDKGRREGRTAGQYLILGSASHQLLRQTSESLAGRAVIVDMGGLNALEIPQDRESLRRLWFRGGYPECFLADSEDASRMRLTSLVRAFLERDLPEFGARFDAPGMRRLWAMLAHLQGEPLNRTKLASSLDISTKTVSAHIDLLEHMLMVRTLRPWYANIGKRLAKTPRVYVRDSGVLHQLLKIGDLEGLMTHPVVGKSYEGFVIENLIAVSPPETDALYYRSSNGAEIDLLLDVPGRGLWAIEVKLSFTPKVPVGFRHACRDVGASRKLVVYPGKDEYPLRGGVTAVPLQKLMRELAQPALR